MNSVFPKESKTILTGNYLKLSKLEEGEETRIRIMGAGIYGWEDWTPEMKPVRFRGNEKPTASINPDRPAKEFVTFCVWNYETESIQILQLTQKKVMKALMALEEKKGLLTDYDLRIVRTGEGKQSQYTLLPCSPTKIPEEAKEALETRPVDLEQLYEGKDPFTPGNRVKLDSSDLGALAKILAHNIDFKGDDADHLVDYLAYAKPQVPKPIEEVVEVWIKKPTEFLKAYGKWLAGRQKIENAVNS